MAKRKQPDADDIQTDVVSRSENPDYSPDDETKPVDEEGKFDAFRFLALARDRMEACTQKERLNFERAETDLNMASGEGQWPGKIKTEREADGRPCLTFNRYPQFIDQVIGEYRKNPPNIKIRTPAGSLIGVDEVTPVEPQQPQGTMGAGPIPEGGPPQADPSQAPQKPKRKYKFAEVMGGIIKNIESACHADLAYEWALECAVTCGMGHYQILSRYVDDSFDQEVYVQQIQDPFSVRWDPNATDYHRRDARFAFIDSRMSMSAFKEEYPGAIVDQEGLAGNSEVSNMADWLTDQEVRVCEYFTVEKELKILKLLSNDVLECKTQKEWDAVAGELAAAGITVVKEREVESNCVYWYKITAYEILEGPVKLPGKYIPIISVWGKEQWHQGAIRRRSLISNSHDAQRMYNFMRPLSLDTPLPTPTGWTTMGAVKAGDFLFDENGNPTKVLGTSPIHLHHECFKVTFDDGNTIVADAEHPWAVEERGKRKGATWDWQKKIVETKDLLPKKHYICSPRPLDTPDVDLPVHPYFLGVWLGDGSTAEPRISAGFHDAEDMRKNLISCGLNVGPARVYKNSTGAEITVHGVRAAMREIGVLGNKHIPDVYLRASTSQRRMLMQGLMDTDGTINKKTRSCYFVTSCDALASGFRELAASLGIRVTSKKQKSRHSKLVGYDVTLKDVEYLYFTAPHDEPVFMLERKRATQTALRPTHWRRTKRIGIKSVEQVPSVPVKCVGVDAPSHLFLAGLGMIPTHNSAAAEYIALAPKAPFIIAATQLEGFKNIWKDANKKNLAYLPYKAVEGLSKPERMSPPMISSGISNEVVTANEDVKSTMGMYDASIGRQSNEVSGKAILARAQEGDTMAYAFIDNAARSLVHAADVMISYVVDLYDTERAQRIMNPDGTDDIVIINQRIQTGPDKFVTIHDLRKAKYECVADVGPSYLTRKLESADSMMKFLEAYPAAAPVIGDLIALNSEWEGAEELARRLRKMIPAQVTGDPQPPDPNLQMQLETEKTKLEAARVNAETARFQAEAKQAEAQIAAAQSQAFIQDMIAKGIAQHMQERDGMAPPSGPMAPPASVPPAAVPA